MAKADFPIPKNPLKFNIIGGIDESVQDTETEFGLSNARGVAPYYTGTLQRMFGKKVIDVDPTASIMEIAQGFNGFGTFCYWVQTFDTLYCHTCPTPPDLFINYTLPTNLGVDEDGFTRDIFGRSENLELPQDLGISCLFAFPTVIPPPDEISLWYEW